MYILTHVDKHWTTERLKLTKIVFQCSPFCISEYIGLVLPKKKKKKFAVIGSYLFVTFYTRENDILPKKSQDTSARLWEIFPRGRSFVPLRCDLIANKRCILCAL